MPKMKFEDFNGLSLAAETGWEFETVRTESEVVAQYNQIVKQMMPENSRKFKQIQVGYYTPKDKCFDGK